VNPFFFGDPERPLYGVYHPPRGADSGQAVLLCYPVGAEYMRAHRAFRQLTTFLTRQGMHVLRFDYLGTGDSSGSGVDASLDQWLEDIALAIDELKESAGVESVAVVGLRFGATLAQAATKTRSDVSQVVLWDPVAEGAEFLAQAIDSRPEDVEAWGLPAGTVGLGGFPLTPEFHSQLSAIRLADLRPAEGQRVDLIVSADAPEVVRVAEAWSTGDADVRYRCVPSEGDWSKGDRFGSALIPQAIIAGVVESLTDGNRGSRSEMMEG
jgi:pimeloyl-ACP methyl ester carboxylesterase